MLDELNCKAFPIFTLMVQSHFYKANFILILTGIMSLMFNR